MTQEPPITPPLELVDQWICALEYQPDAEVFSQAARWGADQELEACCDVLAEKSFAGQATLLREWRRPKPPSLKEQALEQLDCIPTHDNEGRPNGIDLSILRRALEALPDD